MQEVVTETAYYNLKGVIIVTGWYGGRGYARLNITTDEKGFERIKADPLQDYLDYGVKSVDYVQFDVYRYYVKITERKMIIEHELEPMLTIEAGEYPSLSSDEEEFLMNLEPISITI
jgi:beta-xylosidase